MHVFTFISSLLIHVPWRNLRNGSHSAILNRSYPRRNIVATTHSPPNCLVLTNAQMQKLYEILLHKFSDPSLLARALTHRSIVNSTTSRAAFYEYNGQLREIPQNNERLEILGDRVLGLIVVKSLYDRNNLTSEGQISTVSQTLVSGKVIHNQCTQLGLNSYLLQADSLRGKEGSRYGNSFEALLGALFLDGGLDVANHFYVKRVLPLWEKHTTDPKFISCHKRILQEYLVRHGLPAPRMGTQLKYCTIHYNDDTKMFTRVIELFGRTVGEGIGRNVQSADQEAAERVHRRMNRLKNGTTTCFLIRLARRADDSYSLTKLQQTRSAQIDDQSAVP